MRRRGLTNSHSNSDADRNSDGHSNCDSHCDSHRHSICNSNTATRNSRYADTAPSADASASPVGRLRSTQ